MKNIQESWLEEIMKREREPSKVVAVVKLQNDGEKR